MRISNPPLPDKPDRVVGDYAYYREDTPDEEIVHISTHRSNQTYYTPEKVLDPTGCKHEFIFTDIGKREIECQTCHYPTTVHVGINYTEEDGKSYISIKNSKYPISLI